jgi:MOSC domain-containing protein YiiM
MWQGSVVSISIAPGESESTRSVDEARAIAGRGLEGDRYCKSDGETWDDPGKEVTLIAAEAIEAMAEENGLTLDYKDARRNVITRGVPLNDLIDREFSVGEVRLRGVRLNEPCAHLASLTDQRVLKGLVHRGGLRAQILNDGVIRVGDAVTQA